jgi:hypothetical protein
MLDRLVYDWGKSQLSFSQTGQIVVLGTITVAYWNLFVDLEKQISDFSKIQWTGN